MLHKLLRLASTRNDRERALSVLEPRVVCCLESPFLKRRVDQLHALDWRKPVQKNQKDRKSDSDDCEIYARKGRA